MVINKEKVARLMQLASMEGFFDTDDEVEEETEPAPHQSPTIVTNPGSVYNVKVDPEEVARLTKLVDVLDADDEVEGGTEPAPLDSPQPAYESSDVPYAVLHGKLWPSRTKSACSERKLTPKK